MKVIGALFLIIAGATFGHIQAIKKERRVIELSALVSGLQMLITEVVYGRTLLTDACLAVGSSVSEVNWLFEDVAGLLKEGKTAADAWRTVVTRSSPSSYLNEEDRRPLLRVGAIIGLSEANDQHRHLRLAQMEIERRLAEARDKLPQSTKLYRALGVGSGLVMVILLY